MRLFPAKPSRPAKRALHAAVARRGTTRTPSFEEDEEEPTTSFKTALVVVVLLHLVAAGGVYMFDSIKTHRSAAPVASPASAAKKPAAAVAQATPAARPKPAAAAATPAETVKKPAAAPAVAEARDSGTLYTVSKGDSPAAIARKLHVGYDDLLKLNKIDDPKKLRIGQKLRIPVKPRAAAN